MNLTKSFFFQHGPKLICTGRVLSSKLISSKYMLPFKLTPKSVSRKPRMISKGYECDLPMMARYSSTPSSNRNFSDEQLSK